MYPNKMLEYGYPRNDIMHAENREEIAENLRRKLGIPEGKKTILYAPTWRDDEFYGSGQYKFTLKLDLPKMKWPGYFRKHINIKSTQNITILI